MYEPTLEVLEEQIEEVSKQIKEKEQTIEWHKKAIENNEHFLTRAREKLFSLQEARDTLERIQKIGPTKDVLGHDCEFCGKGKYRETSINDNSDGNLHCLVCNHEVKRHQKRL